MYSMHLRTRLDTLYQRRLLTDNLTGDTRRTPAHNVTDGSLVRPGMLHDVPTVRDRPLLHADDTLAQLLPIDHIPGQPPRRLS